MYEEVEHSPDGRIRIDYWLDEWGMGKWDRDPTVTDTKSGETWLRLRGGTGETEWRPDGTFVLRFEYPSYYGTKFEFHFDANAGTMRVGRDGEVVPVAEGQACADRVMAPAIKKRQQQLEAMRARSAAESAAYAQEKAEAARAVPAIADTEAGAAPAPPPPPAPAPESKPEPEPVPRPTAVQGFASDARERRFAGYILMVIGLGMFVVLLAKLVMI